MDRERFLASLAQLKVRLAIAHRLLGIGKGTVYRIAAGQAEVPPAAVRLLDMYERYGVPEEHKP